MKNFVLFHCAQRLPDAALAPGALAPTSRTTTARDQPNRRPAGFVQPISRRPSARSLRVQRRHPCSFVSPDARRPCVYRRAAIGEKASRRPLAPKDPSVGLSADDIPGAPTHGGGSGLPDNDLRQGHHHSSRTVSPPRCRGIRGCSAALRRRPTAQPTRRTASVPRSGTDHGMAVRGVIVWRTVPAHRPRPS
jgi:hypothetical protein